VVDAPQLMYSGRPAILRSFREALVKEGAHVLAGATAKMLRAGVKGSTRVLEVELVGDDISQQITAAAKSSAPILWSWHHTGGADGGGCAGQRRRALLADFNPAGAAGSAAFRGKEGAPQRGHAGHCRRVLMSDKTILIHLDAQARRNSLSGPR